MTLTEFEKDVENKVFDDTAIEKMFFNLFYVYNLNVKNSIEDAFIILVIHRPELAKELEENFKSKQTDFINNLTMFRAKRG